MKKILVVDDDPNICELLEQRLRANNYEVIKASNGVEAFVKAREEKPQLIVLDVSMPVMNGYQFAKEVQWHDDIKKIPILILTAHAQTQDLFDIAGIVRFLTKPFNPNELLEMVNECMKNHKDDK